LLKLIWSVTTKNRPTLAGGSQTTNTTPYSAEIAERKKVAEEELARIEDAWRYVEHLDLLS
jgi:hypothetical protein